MQRSFICLFFCLFSLLARAELTVEITQGVDEPTPIAVVPFAWSGNQALPDDSAWVRRAMHRHGVFSNQW